MKRLMLLLLVLPLWLQAQTSDTLRSIDQLFSGWNNATPGGAVLVARGNQVLYQKAFGLADLEHNTPNTVETIFECGSVSKQFTAFAALLLAHEGKIALSDPIHKYIPELPDYGNPITIQQLINHTSGLKDWGSIGELAGWPRTTKVYTLELAMQILTQQHSLNFVPGSQYSYSNAGYTVLVAIIERVTKNTLEEFTRTRMFEPLGMTHTRWRSNFRQVIPNRAVAYRSAKDSFEQLMPFENIYGHGGLLTTVHDLMIWNQQLAHPTLGGNDMPRWRAEQGVLNDGSKIGYANGLFIDSYNGFHEIGHSGATAGYRGWLAYYPAKQLSVVLLSNDGRFNPQDVGRKVAAVFLGQPAVVATKKIDRNLKLTEAARQKWAGVWRQIDGYETRVVEVKDDQLYTNTTPLQLLHPDTLYQRGSWWISNGQEIKIQNGTSVNRFRKVASAEPNPALVQFAGRYWSDDAQTELRIEVSGEKLWVHRGPTERFALTPVFRDAFLTDEGLLFEFTRSKGAVAGLHVSMSRAYLVPFKKVIK
ncbi:MAG TPA: serine hydrolase domain-containing protein [Cyclobacteriaceae bacterium]|nr:serine hydrolase domain-containing protein [Cyclobacteriaceae bacterium]